MKRNKNRQHQSRNQTLARGSSTPVSAVSGSRRETSMAKATWAGKTIAESTATVEVEGNQYFPPDAVVKNFLKPSNHTSVCSWKGTAHYYHVEVDGMKNENAAWYYPEPKPAAAEIKDRIAFWKGVQVQS
jgi:uncharacterized protein (DUF427 family)